MSNLPLTPSPINGLNTPPISLKKKIQEIPPLRVFLKEAQNWVTNPKKGRQSKPSFNKELSYP